MSQISALKRITTKDQQNCEKFNQIILKKDLNQIFIGRDIDCNYRISSIEISRRHAVLEYSVSDNYWTVSDLNSTNGLFINSIQLQPNSPYRLVNGDRVSFGPPNQSQFCYQFVDNYSQNSSNCVSYELSSINLTTIPVIPIVTRIQNSSTNSSLLSSSLHFDIESNQSRTISLTTTMPTRSGLIYSGSTNRSPRVSSTSSVIKKTVSRKTSVDQKDTQSITSFEEHDYSRNSSSNRNSSDKNNKKRMSLKLKDNNCDQKSKASKISEIERKLIAKEKEKLEKSKKSLEHQKAVELKKIKRKEEELKKKQKELDRKLRDAKKREEEIEKKSKDLLKEKKRFDDKRQELNKESVRQSAKRKLRSSSGRESIDSKRQCSEDKQNIIEELLESELTCSVCSEYFIQPVNLNCSHTFCLSCIEEWKKQKSGSHMCPICREPTENYNRELILDNLIDQFVVKMKPNIKEHRKKLLEERKKLLEKKSTHNSNANRNGSTASRGNGLSRLIPSLHFFLRSTNTDSDSDTDDVDVIGLDFGNNFLSSSSSVSSASSDSDSDDSSDDSSDDESVANSSPRSSSSDSEPESTGHYVSLTSTNNPNDSNFSYSSDSDVESVVSLHSNHSNSIQIDINSFDGSDDSDDSDFSIDD